MTLRRLARPHEAEPLIREALEAFRKQRGKDDFDTIVFQGDLAVTLRDMGKWEEAEKFYSIAIAGLAPRSDMSEAAMYPYRHYHGIAHISSKVNKIDSAKSFLERAVTGNTSLYGEHSAAVINDKLCLVKLLIQINRIDEASDFIRDIVASMSHVRGDPDGEFARLHELVASLTEKMREGRLRDLADRFNQCFVVKESASRTDTVDADGILSPS